MRGTTHAQWETGWPTPQFSARRRRWWCGGTVSARLRRTSAALGCVAQWTDTRCWLHDMPGRWITRLERDASVAQDEERGSAPSQRISNTHSHAQEKPPPSARRHIFTWVQMSSVVTKTHAGTSTARGLSHTINPITAATVQHFRFELKQICNPNVSTR